MEEHKLYWSDCSINDIKLSKELVEMTKCKSCGKSRIQYELHLFNGKQSLNLKLNSGVCLKDVCRNCDENEYYKNIKDPLLS